MKKFRRIIGIISGILVVLGILLVIIGTSMGGAYVVAEDVMAGRLSIGSNDILFGEDDDIDTSNMINLSEETNKIEASQVNCVEVYCKYGEIQIMTWNEDYYQIEGLREDEKIKYSVEDGVLKVCTVGNGNKFLFWGKEKRVAANIMVPASQDLDKLVINIGAGTIHCINMQKIKQLDVVVGAGEGIFDGIYADSCSFKVGAGEATIENCNFMDSDFKVGVGDLDVEGSITGNINIDCGVGSIDLSLKQLKQDFNYKVKVGMGSVEIGDEHYSGNVSNTNIDNSSDKTIDIKCGMGDVEFEFLDR